MSEVGGNAPDGKTPTPTSLTGDERAELERLRTEVAELRSKPAAPPAPPRRRKGTWRAPVATVLIVLGCILAPISVIGIWTANQVSNTNRYVENVSPLIHEPAIQAALTDKISAQINAHLPIQSLTNQAAATLTSKGFTRVGTLLHSFSGSLASAVQGFIHTQVAKIVKSQQVANLWVEVNRRVHAQLVNALSGQHSSQRGHHHQQRQGRAQPRPVHRPWSRRSWPPKASALSAPSRPSTRSLPCSTTSTWSRPSPGTGC